MSPSYDLTHVDVRRQKVLAFLVKGLTQNQIAVELGVDRQTIRRDIKWLRTTKRIDIELIRAFNWDEIMNLLPDLTKLQQAKLRIDIQKILEPKKLETSGKVDISVKFDKGMESEDDPTT